MPRVGKRGPRGHQKRAQAMSAAAKARGTANAWDPVLSSGSGRGKTSRAQAKASTMRAITKSMQPDGIIRRGGARPNSGPEPGMPWVEIARCAKLGSGIDDIIAGLDSIRAEWLEDPNVQDRLKATVAQGNAYYRLQLQRSMVKKAKTGSVQAQALLARNHMNFDQQGGAGGMDAPDTNNIAAKLEELITKLAGKIAREETNAKPGQHTIRK